MAKQQTLNFQVTKRRLDDENKRKRRRLNAEGITETEDQACKTTCKPSTCKGTSTSTSCLVVTPTKIGADRVATPTKSPGLSKFNSSLEITSPVKRSYSSSRQLRYEHLMTPTPSTLQGGVVNLPLPNNYKLLEEQYRCTNVVLSMLESRKEICTFKKLKKSVQEMTRKNFELKSVSQMKHLYPESLIIRQERNVPGTLNKEEYSSYQLTIQSSVKEWTPAIHLNRQRAFHNKLLTEAIKHHKEFLSSLCPPVIVPDDKLYRWHINFTLHNVPDVPLGELPHPPLNDTYNTASDLLKQTERKLSARVHSALEKVTKNITEQSPPPPPPPPPSPSHLKGISSAIINRIRHKEAVRAATIITRDPQVEQQLIMLSRLTEMSRIIRSLFVTEGKAAIEWSHLIQKVTDSHTSLLNTEQVEVHLNFLLQVISDWFIVVTVKRCKYVKLKNKSLSHKVITELIRNKEHSLSN